jgi:protein tyrosine/serine phosphatase
VENQGTTLWISCRKDVAVTTVRALTPAERRLAFEHGCFNARDLGGLVTEDGRRLRAGVVYRADGLHRLPPGEVERLAAAGIRTVVDLRTAAELEVAPSFRGPDGIEVRHLPVLQAVWPKDEFGPEIDDDPVAFLVDRYAEMLDEGRDAIAAVFALLADPDRRPLAFHCSAGKDRTGVVAGLVLGLAGVPDDDIAEDYASSAEAMADLVAWIRRVRPQAATSMDEQPAAFLSCPADAMHGFLDVVRTRFGSVRSYLDSIGVPAATIAAVRDALLDEG